MVRGIYLYGLRGVECIAKRYPIEGDYIAVDFHGVICNSSWDAGKSRGAAIAGGAVLEISS